MLPSLDHAVAIDVSQGVLAIDVVFEAHVVGEDVVEGIQTGEPRLQVFSCVAILAVVHVSARLWITPKLVQDPVLDRLKGRQATLQVDGLIQDFQMLQKLLHCDLVVVVKIEHFKASGKLLVGFIILIDVIDQSSILLEGNFLVLRTLIQVTEVDLTLNAIAEWNVLEGRQHL